jgi:hypothetical protein
MPIAIYRHMKLFLASPRWCGNPVTPLSRKQMRDVRVTKVAGTDIEDVSVHFTTYSKRRSLNMNRDVYWEFSDKLRVRTVNWRGMQNAETVTEIPPLCCLAWTMDDSETSIFDQIEEGISSRAIIERYLMENVANPDGYWIVVIDFNPNRTPSQPRYVSHLLRSTDEVAKALVEDDGETPDEWIKLLMGEKTA